MSRDVPELRKKIENCLLDIWAEFDYSAEEIQSIIMEFSREETIIKRILKMSKDDVFFDKLKEKIKGEGSNGKKKS